MRALRFTRFVPALLASTLSSACIIDASGDDDGGEGATTGPLGTSSVSSTATDSGSEGVVDESGSSSDGGTDTGGPMGECTDNLVVDPGFEAGTPSTAWEEASVVFGTPICDASCTDEPGAGPYAGDWYAWYGGLEATGDGTPQPDVSSVAQTINVPAGDNAWLSFRFEINASAGSGDDVFAIDIDDTNVFMATDAEIDDYEEYRLVQLDVSELADGGDHVFRFHGDLAGIDVTNFFLDEIALVSCDAGGGSSEGSSDSASSGDSGTGTSGDSSTGSADSGESGSSGSGSGSSSAGG